LEIRGISYLPCKFEVKAEVATKSLRVTTRKGWPDRYKEKVDLKRQTLPTRDIKKYLIILP
jgi:hypothetical protein